MIILSEDEYKYTIDLVHKCSYANSVRLLYVFDFHIKPPSHFIAVGRLRDKYRCNK